MGAKKETPIPEQRQDGIIYRTMEDMMHSSMLPYAEYVIMERALPRVEDGLKPVQRRILYTMQELSMTPDKPYKKSARIVGDCLGKYHPHGDTSVYDAMVRMAQDFNMRYPLVQGHGNFGSVDGDSAAAMRYTEVRMAPLALELLRHLEKDTVPFGLNFDDSLKEPLMLPARFPNLLVNGAVGIAIGLATNIPPHNLCEVIDAVVARIQDPKMTLDEVMKYIVAPDFPMGGQLLISDEIRTAYETGKGKLTIRATTHIEKGSNGRQLIVVTELPYQVNKANMLEKILALSETRREMFSGIADIRDESDRTGIRAVIEVRAGADAEKILTYLYKYSDLQITFGVNMVAIAEGQPKLLGLLPMLDHYIAYQRKTVTRRLKYELEQAEKREHILSALIVAVKNIDRVIQIIKSSKNQPEARNRLMEEFDFTQIQAQAILDMRLGRLTALEVETLEREYAELLTYIARVKAILASPRLLDKLIISEHEDIKKRFGDERRTRLVEGEAQIVIDESEFKVTEDCVVGMTAQGFLKRMNPKVYQKGAETGAAAEETDCLAVTQLTTDSRLMIFTNAANMFSLAAEAIPDHKWKDKGSPLNTLFTGVGREERIISTFVFGSSEGELVFATKQGMVKRVALSEFEVKKSRIAACGLKEGDELISVFKSSEASDLLLVSRLGMSIVFPKAEIPAVGRTAKGVIGMKLAPGDEIVFAGELTDKGDVLVATERGYFKRTSVSEYEPQSRAGKGMRTVNLQKNGQNGTYLVFASPVRAADVIVGKTKNGEPFEINVSDLPKGDKVGRGTQTVTVLLDNIVTECRVK